MEQGLIHALLLDGQGGVKHLNASQVEQWNPNHGELWLHMDYSAYDSKEWLFHGSDIDVTVADVLLSSESRPRFNMIDGGVILAWRGINPKLEEIEDSEDLVALRLWKDEGRLISTRHRHFHAVAEVVALLEKGKGPHSLGELLVLLADKTTNAISEHIDELEDKMSELEELVIDEGNMSLRTNISGLRRQVIALRRYFAPQKEALARFSAERLIWLADDDRMELREVVDRITRGVEDLEALRERAAVAQEELQNKISEELNNRMYVLSIITAIFLPLGFLTGLFGVNIGGMPGVENPAAFREFALILTVLVVIQLVLFRWKKWF